MSVEPLSKNELYLSACCEGCGCTGLPEPLTRKEHLLYELAEKLAGGGGGTGAPYVDTSKLTNLDGFCKNGKNLEFGLDPNLDTSNVTSMFDMFHTCKTILHAPKINTSNVTNMQALYYNCEAMIDVEVLDTSSATTFMYLFGNCRSLQTITPELNGDSVINMDYMFDNCNELVEVRFKENSICVWLDMRWSAKLSKSSILSVLKGLRLTLAERHLKLNASLEEKIINDTELNTAYQAAVDAGWVIEFLTV